MTVLDNVLVGMHSRLNTKLWQIFLSTQEYQGVKSRARRAMN
jgi:ABC-type branched-subunit amino acid transport system ATPase component